MKTTKSIIFKKVTVVLFFLMFVGCDKVKQESVEKKSPFNYDSSVISEVKPWTSENFRNNPENFQFAIIGDRTGGANVQGTYAAAMDQLNLLQPNFQGLFHSKLLQRLQVVLKQVLVQLRQFLQ